MKDCRAILAARTRHAHEALHDHEWIGQLSSPALRYETYRSLLRAYYLFFHHVEETRHASRVFHALSLSQAIHALRRDLILMSAEDLGGAPHVPLTLTTDYEILGALYVLHGSRFGARILARNVSSTLPGVPATFLNCNVPKVQWNTLLKNLDRVGSSAQAVAPIVSAANRTFRAFGDHVTRSCTAQDDRQSVA